MRVLGFTGRANFSLKNLKNSCLSQIFLHLLFISFIMQLEQPTQPKKERERVNKKVEKKKE
jgi:hypothetical protein